MKEKNKWKKLKIIHITLKKNNKFLVDGSGLIKVRGVYYKNFKVLCEELNLSYQIFIQRKNHSDCVEYCIYPFSYPHKNTRE